MIQVPNGHGQQGLKLIVGPMKSRKSQGLADIFAPLSYSNVPFKLYQHCRHTRDAGIKPRDGKALEATPVRSFSDIPKSLVNTVSIIGIDEIHMFDPRGVKSLNYFLRNGIAIIGAGLNMDYRGKYFTTIIKLQELGMRSCEVRIASCEICHRFNATHTRVYRNKEVVTKGLPAVLPEDGTYVYKPVCYDCFMAGR